MGPSEVVTLGVPAADDLSVDGKKVDYNAAAGEVEILGPATLTWSNGVRLTTREMKVSILRSPAQKGARVFLEPLPAGHQ